MPLLSLQHWSKTNCCTGEHRGKYPRTTARQYNRNNISAGSPSEYYQHQVTIPMLDYLFSEMESRFNIQTSAVLFQVVLLLPSELVQHDSEIASNELINSVNLHEDTLPSPAVWDTKLHCSWMTWYSLCECSISSLWFLKTYLHTSVGEARLNGLAMLFIHGDIACDVEAIVNLSSGTLHDYNYAILSLLTKTTIYFCSSILLNYFRYFI